MSSYEIAGVSVDKAEVQRGQIVCGYRPDSSPVHIPFLVARGAQDGPTLWLGSLVHGPEIGGIEVLRKVTHALNLSDLSGTVLAVPICNPFGYYAPSTRTPEDGQNINRTFPGTDSGLLSNRVAHVLSSQLLPHADYVIDVHSNIRPSLLHTIVKGGSGDVVERSEAMANTMGVTKIWTESNIEDETGSAVVRTSGLSLTEWTTSQGKPSFVVELADQRRIDAASVDATVTGVRNVLKHLGMVKGRTTRVQAGPPWAAHPPNTDRRHGRVCGGRRASW